jgi:hypothetical protein
VAERGHPVAEVAQRLGQHLQPPDVDEARKDAGEKRKAVDTQADQLRRLKAELKRVTQERNILKRRRVLCQDVRARYTLIVELQDRFPYKCAFDAPLAPSSQEYGNATFFQLLKPERIRRKTYDTGEGATRDVFGYIEMSGNPRHRHSFSQGMSPAKYEKQYLQRLASFRKTHGDSLSLCALRRMVHITKYDGLRHF